jgi:protein gp37
MSDKTEISWTDATWNPVVGCTKVSAGCDNCYAIRTAHRMTANPNPLVSQAYAGTEAGGEWTGKVNLLTDRLDQPLRWRKPRRIFVNAQSDLFHKDVPDEFIARVFAVMALTPRHTYQVLTKRHGRMRSLLRSDNFRPAVEDAMRGIVAAYRTERAWYAAWPLPNLWLGVSVEDQSTADLRMPALLDTPAAVRWISAEPLLGPVDLRGLLQCFHCKTTHKFELCDRMSHPVPYGALSKRHVDWVVVGGESGPGARPMHPAWARTLRDQCAASGVPYFFKQWGEWAPEDQTPEETVIPAQYRHDDSTGCMRLGRRASGDLLDGVLHHEWPVIL